MAVRRIGLIGSFRLTKPYAATALLTCIEVIRYIYVRRYEELVMLRLFGSSRELAVEFCERYGAVCDAACRRDANVGRVRDRALLLRRGRR